MQIKSVTVAFSLSFDPSDNILHNLKNNQVSILCFFFHSIRDFGQQTFTFVFW